MKIAVYPGDHRPDGGGNHSFELEILTSIMGLASKCSHDFFILSRYVRELESQITEVKESPVKFVSLPGRIRNYVIAQPIHIARYYLKSICSNNTEAWGSKLILKTLLQNKIEIIWNLTQKCLSMEIPYIATVFDLQHRLQPYFPEVSNNREWLVRDRLFDQMLRRASLVLTGTEVGKKEIEFFYQVPPQRIKVLPLPTRKFALDNFENEIPLPERYSSSVPYILYPAQFWPHKNHMCLLLALKSLREKYGIILRLFLTGSDKGNRRYIEQKVSELELDSQVSILGFITEQELVALYKHAFALTFVTFFGPDNLPPLEAFALGCPVIASSVSGAEEQLGDAALFFDPKEPEQLVNRIKMLYENQLLRTELIKRGRKRAQHFTAQDYVERIFTLLDDFEPFKRCWSNSNIHT